MCGTKLSLLARNGPIWRFFCMQGEFYTVLATKKPSRESFVPNARQRSSEPTQQHTRPHRHGAEDTRGAAGPGRGAGCGRLVGPARVRRATARQISHAIPPRHGSMHTQKPRNINDQISIVEILLGELHAKLPRCSQVSTPYRDQAPQVWRAPGSGGSEGLAAVPVGGGAWPGFEATHRAKLAARTARGRADAHGHTTQPGTHTAQTAYTARGPKRRSASGPHTHACQLLTG